MTRYGIKITLTETNPLRQSHLLGEDWATCRWYDSEQERDSAFQSMQRRLPNYRLGDTPAQVLTKIEDED